MAQLVALPEIAHLQGVNLDQCVIDTVEVPIENPAWVYNVFKNEPYRLPELSPNHVASVTPAAGDKRTIDSEMEVVYYPEDKGKATTERFKYKLASTNDSAKTVTFKILEGVCTKYYHETLVFELAVYKMSESNVARWTVAYEKKHSGSPDVHKYMDLLVKVTKDVDEHPPSTN